MRRVRGGAWVLLAAGVWGCTPEAPSPAPAEAERTVPVMGTVLVLRAWAPDEATARRANDAAWLAVARVDSLMSHYRPESEISRLSGAAGTGAWTPLSPATLEVLGAALDWAERSGGAFDPTVGPLMHAWGFFQHEPRRPTGEELARAAALVGFRDVTLEPDAARGRLERAGMLVDLGALAKGYALDRALEAMEAAGAVAGLADLGGNVAAFGRGPADDGRWTLGIRHPRDREALVGTVRVAGGSVATSGDYEQMFEEGGVRYSHLMDPRRGEPARGVVAVTVAAPDGMTADALSTVLFVLGPDEGRDLLARMGMADEITAVWILDGNHAHPDGTDVDGDLPGAVVVHRGGGASVDLAPQPPS